MSLQWEVHGVELKSCFWKVALININILSFWILLNIPGPITLRRGDAVYVRAENGKNLIAQIDSMWTAPNE